MHVISRENDPQWYEACNPLKNERGLVPVSYFDNVGKTVRDSGDSARSGSATHDSGYAEQSTPPTQSGRPSTSNPPDMPMPGHRTSKSMSKGGGIYGIVSYDFHAERPDELEAKEGEAIIVIAQSNPEWFVAKPITRLGGPGLIPVSFIEIRDMTTGQPVPDTLEAVQKAGIPRVEEWKKMAAEYKNTSIPLGTVSSSQQVQQLQNNMDRMSLNQPPQTSYSYDRQPAGNPYTYQQQAQQNLYAPVRASVPRYIFADEKFHFIVECKLSNGSHWDLSRIYEDFYELQINLINAFPEEAGQTGKPRILPYMPGPVKFVTDNISEGRRANLDEYLRDLLKLQQHVTCSSLVRNFFAPRQGDYEVDPNAENLDGHARPMQPQGQDQRYSQASQQSFQQNSGYPQQQQQQRQPPNHQYTQSQASSNGYGHQRQQQSYASNDASHYRSPSGYSQQQQQTPPQQQQQVEAMPSLGMPTTQHANPSGTSLGASASQVKVKAWFDRDTCVVIRMGQRGKFSFDQLYTKIVERRRLEYKGQDQQFEKLEIEYRDENDGEYYRLEGQKDLDIALDRNEKLTLAVRAAEP